MAVTATLVGHAHNHLRYLIVDDNGGPGHSITITTTGAASPDLLTDSLAGPIKQCAKAFTDGLGKLAAGALTQAQSRAIWVAQDSDTVLGNELIPRCVPRVIRRSGTSGNWTVDADVDGSGHPTVVVVHSGISGVAEIYLDIELEDDGIGL